MLIRPITDLREFEMCYELQREVFGVSDADLFPIRFYVVLNSIGGLILGAFDGDTLAGYVSTIPGIRGGVPYWYSQVMAVRREYWNSGIGAGLKLAQRDAARQRG